MNFIVAPIILQLVAAIICLFALRQPLIQRIVAGLASNAAPVLGFLLIQRVYTEGTLAIRLGSWPDAMGIALVVDLLSATMITAAGVAQACVYWFLVAGGADATRERFMIYPLFLLLAMGVNWAFTTGDLFNLFVSFELMLICSYVLLAHGNGRSQVRETIKYVVLNMLISALFLLAAGFAYGSFGALNFADLAIRMSQAHDPSAETILGAMLLVVFGTKAALFPMFFWMPDSYPQAPPGILAFIGGLLTKVGVYCLYRVFTLMFPEPMVHGQFFQPLIVSLGGATMLIGVLCALSQMTMRRLLSFHIISQIGYMVFALGIFTPAALAYGIFHVLHNVVVKGSLFLVADSVRENEGTDNLEKLGGLMSAYPGLAIAFALAGFSLGGIPPLSGFFGKYGIVLEGIRNGWIAFTVVSLVTGLLTLSSMVKIWRYAFWRENTGLRHGKNRGVIAATWALVAASLLLAALSGPVVRLCMDAAAQSFDRRQYITAVVGEKGVAAMGRSTPEEVVDP